MTLVFIHGAGCTGAVFESQLAAFAGSHAPNLPGHLSAGEPSGIGEFAQWLEGHIAAQGFTDVVLCGHSMGGAIALETALRKPAWLHGVVVLGGGGRMRVAPAILEGLQADFEGTAAAVAGYFFARNTPERTQAAVDMMRTVGQAQTLRDFRACNAFDVLDRLGKIAAPLLAVTGEADQMMPAKFALALADRVPGAQARIVPDAGHFVMAERPIETNESIAAFLGGLS